MIFSLLLGAVLTYVGWTVHCLEANVRKARALGVPVARTPFDVDSHLWVGVQPLLWKVLACIPIQWSSYPDIVRFSHRNWNFLEKSRPIEKFGPVWALVSPGGVHLQIGDPVAIEDIFTRWRQFVRPVHKYKVVSIYGPSLFNAPIEEWPRHRKAVSAPFNESTMKFVWLETIRQTRLMRDYWCSQSAATIPALLRDLQTVTLNVLASSVFRETYEFIGSANLKDTSLSHTGSFRDALMLVHKYIILLMVIPYQALLGPIVPRSLYKIGYAANRLKDVITKVITEERAALKDGKPGSGGLVTSLVRAIDNTSNKGALSLEETLGNIFVINFAGLDTTANVLSFVIMRLAGEPSVQDWVHEEILSVTQGRPVENWEYDLYPRLKRCLAVFNETLRLYAPVSGLPKMTAGGVQTIQVGERLIAIPPGTDVFPMLTGMHTHPRHWDDPFVWKPSRWISRSSTSIGINDEELLIPQNGTFFPWAEGPQGCVGKKVSQVEAVAALASLLITHRIRVKTEPGETHDDVRKRIEECCADNSFTIALTMNNPTKIVLECVEL